jgi:outer membrane protein
VNNNTSLIWNIVLTIAVAVLFFLHFSGNPDGSSTAADGAVVPGRRTVYVQVDSLLKNYEFFKDTKKELENRKIIAE